MTDDHLLILRGDEIFSLLRDRETQILDEVAAAYRLHRQGASSLPHSSFLRFPEEPANRIICLPAFLGGDYDLAGMKWISSFPGNITSGLDRASALMALNSARTGHPEALLEASIVSSKRTAASAALAARVLLDGRRVESVALVGCGLINFEILRFLRSALSGLERVLVFDLSDERAKQFVDHCRRSLGEVEIEQVPSMEQLLAGRSLVSFATTAGAPYLDDLSPMAAGGVVLHISLRDLAPRAILAADNVVDDLDHVARAGTSIHLTETEVGHRDFVRCPLADILLGNQPARSDSERAVVFSPFGLGVLDLAVGGLAVRLAEEEGVGTRLRGFLPAPWTARD